MKHFRDFKEYKASDHMTRLSYMADDTAGIIRKGSLVGLITATNKIALCRVTHATGPATGTPVALEIPVTAGEETRFRATVDSVVALHAGAEVNLGLVTEVDTEKHTITVSEDASAIVADDAIYVGDGSNIAIGVIDEDVEGSAEVIETRKMAIVLVHGMVEIAKLQNYFKEAKAQLPLILFI